MSLHCQINFLAQCEALRPLDQQAEFEVGDIVARGFADIGAEPYAVIGHQRLISLLDGRIVEGEAFTEGKHFYRVFNTRQLIAMCRRNEIEIQQLFFENDREWRLDARYSGDAFSGHDKFLESLLARCLIALLLPAGEKPFGLRTERRGEG